MDEQAEAQSAAEQLTSALYVQARQASSLELLLITGDAEKRKMTAQNNPEGWIKIVKTGQGYGTVLRSSALMDERMADNLRSRLISPIQWNQVLFVFSDHLGITKDPVFTDNILYFLLESPRN